MRRINPISIMLASAGAILASGFGYQRVKLSPPPETHRKRGARKNRGGRGGTYSKRINSPHYKAWKKAFGGLAVPAYQG